MSNRLQIRFTPDEMQFIREISKETYLSKSSVVRTFFNYARAFLQSKTMIKMQKKFKLDNNILD